MAEKSFHGKVAIVTGSSSGIGAAVAILLTSKGCSVTITGRNEANLNQVANECYNAGSSNQKVLALPGDICDDKHLEKLVSCTLEKFGQIDILVNNAGIFLKHDKSNVDQEFDVTMRTNLRQPLMLSLACEPHLIKTKGNIMNISSVSSIMALPLHLCYAMSKAALDSMTRSMALGLGAKGVRVNAVNPGYTDTKLLNPKQQNLDPLAATCPLRKVAQSVEIAEIIVFLVSDKASFITGVCHVIDGGLSLTSHLPTLTELTE